MTAVPDPSRAEHRSSLGYHGSAAPFGAGRAGMLRLPDQPLESMAGERVVDRAVDGDVRPDAYTERYADAAVRDLTVSHRQAVGPRSQAQQPLARDAVSYQVVAGDIPRPPPGLQPRPYLMEHLNGPRRGVSVLTGLPGVGKTALAAAYARAKLAAGWHLVAWVNAGDRGSLLAGLAAVADAAGLSDRLERDPADAGVLVRRWLEAEGDRCLLVFDDAEDPDALRPYIPAGGAARVLITSNQQSAGYLGASVPVDAFGADEASAVLIGRTSLDDESGAAAVAAALGHLPLPLALAAPVIAEQPAGYGWYLDQLSALPADAFLTGDDGQPDPADAARTVLLSLQAIRAADPTGVCTQVMVIMAVLSAAGVRRDLLHAAGKAGALAGGGRPVAAGLVDRVLGWLSGRSLLTFSLDGQTVILHRLVARVIRNELARSDMLTACEAAALVLDEYARAVGGSPDRRAVRQIAQQVMALLGTSAGPAAGADEELAWLLLRLRFIAFHHVLELGDSAPLAIAVGEPVTAELERLLGPEHPDTLNSRNSLAAAYLAAGRVAEATRLFEQILVERQHTLGPDDPETLTSRNNLASAYQDAGRSAEAIRLYEVNLETRERLLGDSHPSTLNSRGNLAAALLAAGRATEAIPLLEQTLAGRERVLGPDHPDTRTSRRNLARAYLDAGRVAEAIPLLEQGPDDRAMVPGPPWKNLVNFDEDDGQVAAAIPSASGPRKGRPPAGAVGQLPPASFRRPPADPARRVLPAGVRRPSADPARQPLPEGAERRTQDLAPKDVQYDRGILAAITAGDPAGIAMAYDRYAAALYGYCHWLLRDPADAAAAVQDTFVIAVTTISDRFEAPTLRPRLFAWARNECRRRIRTTAASRDEQASPASQRSAAADQPADATHGELRALIYSILAELGPREREAIELSFRYDLYDKDLASALGVSSSRAHALASQAYGRLERNLSALHTALTRREACPTLRELLEDWDGQLTEHTRDLVGWHIEVCEDCASHGRGALRPVAFSRLLPLALLPPELREQVLSRCSSAAEDAVAYRQRVARRAEPTWLARSSQAIRQVSWDSVLAHPGVAIATLAVTVWVVVAVIVTLLTFAGSRAAHAQVVQPGAGTSSGPAAADPAAFRTAPAVGPATASTSAATTPPPAVSQPAYVPPTVQPSATPSPSPSPSASPSPSPSASPSPPASPSPSPSTSTIGVGRGLIPPGLVPR